MTGVAGGPHRRSAVSRLAAVRSLARLRPVPVQVVVALTPGVQLGVVRARAQLPVTDGDGAGVARRAAAAAWRGLFVGWLVA